MPDSVANPAHTYEEYMVPALFRPWAERLLASAAPAPGERLLDVATGTGIVARLARPMVGVDGHVTGLDPSPEMLDVADAAARREGHDIAWQTGEAERLPFEASRFDVVSCQFGLMFFTDRATALTEMHRVLASGGWAAIGVFQSLERHPFYQELDRAIESHLGMSAVADIFSMGDRAGLEAMLGGAGFTDVNIEPASLVARFPDPDSFLAGEIDVDTASIPAMQHLTAEERGSVTAAIREEMEAPLRAVTDGDAVALEFHAWIATARRQ